MIILAAGKGTRMKSEKAKVLHPIAGKPMITYVVETARKIAGNEVFVVIGHQGEKVRQVVSVSAPAKFIIQGQQKGTGHAVRCALPELSNQIRHVVILCGDVPLLRPETIGRLVNNHIAAGRDLSFLAVEKKDPHGYGRVIMNKDQAVSAIIEEADATLAEKKITTINTGIYCVAKELLVTLLPDIQSKNAQGEIYFTDIVEIACKRHKIVGVLVDPDSEEFMGINTIADLEAVKKMIKNGQFKTA